MTQLGRPPGGEAAGPGGILVGAGAAEIDLTGVLPVEGFTRLLDPIRARVALVDDARGRVAIAVVDMTSLRAALATELRSVVADVVGTALDDVVVVASHTFSAPHLRDGLPPGDEARRNDALHRSLVEAVRRAAQDAVKTLRSGTIASCRGLCDINVNRDVVTADGTWIGADDAGPSDKTVTAAVLRDRGGEVVAVLAGYGVQPGVLADSRLPDGGREVSADLAGAAMRHVEGQYPGAVALFLVGAAADQAPRFTAVAPELDRRGRWSATDLGEAGRVLVGLHGRRLGEAVVRAVERAPAGRAGPATVLRDEVTVLGRAAPPRERIRPRRSQEWAPTGPVALPITVVRLGDLALACLAPEVTAATGMDVVRRSSAPVTAVVTMADGAAKYLADRASFERVSYEAMSSPFMPGAAEEVADRLVRLLERGFAEEGSPVRAEHTGSARTEDGEK